jgi:hypothetical protein
MNSSSPPPIATSLTAAHPASLCLCCQETESPTSCTPTCQSLTQWGVVCWWWETSTVREWARSRALRERLLAQHRVRCLLYCAMSTSLLTGCYQELQDLLHKCGYAPGQDILLLVGDLVNKGPSSAEVRRASENRLSRSCTMLLLNAIRGLRPWQWFQPRACPSPSLVFPPCSAPATGAEVCAGRRAPGVRCERQSRRYRIDSLPQVR